MTRERKESAQKSCFDELSVVLFAGGGGSACGGKHTGDYAALHRHDGGAAGAGERMTQIIKKDGIVVCVTTVPYPPEIISQMKKAGYKVKEVSQ